MADPIPGRRLNEFDFPDDPTGAEVYAEQLGSPVRLKVGEAGGLETVDYSPPSTGTAGTIKSFLDSLWTAGANAGAALIRFVAADAGAVARPVQDKLRERISVGDFGAKGDGVTDDTAAFQAALSVSASKELVIPPGQYKLTAGLTVQPSTRIRGAGRKATYLQFTLPSAAGDALLSINAGGTTVYGGGIRDLDIIDSTPNPGTTAIYAENVVGGYFDNIQTTGGRKGFHFVGGLNRIRDSEITALSGIMSETIGVLAEGNAGVGIYDTIVLNDTAPANQARFGYLFRGGASPTMHAANTYGCQIGCQLTAEAGVSMLWPELVNCQFDTADDTGLIVTTGGGFIYGLTCINVWIGTFGGAGLLIQPNSGTIADAHFVGGRVFGCGSAGVLINGGSRLLFNGVDIAGNGGGATAGVVIAGAVDGATFVGNTIGPGAGFGNTQTYGIQINAVAAQNVSIVGNNLSGNIVDGLINQSTSQTVKIAGNSGYSTPVVAPALLGTWVNNGAPSQAAGYWKDADGVVHLRGVVKGGALATPVFNLPAGYRPSGDEYFPIVAGADTAGMAYVSAGGDVIVSGPAAAFFSINFTFRAA